MKNNIFNDSFAKSSQPLRRTSDGTLGGVAAGVATYLGVKVAYVRAAFVALSLLGGGGLALYLAGWALIPEEGSDVSLAGQLFRHSPSPTS
jgi:phage shock protein PspC (stress-responsive transcriptional regulator)